MRVCAVQVGSLGHITTCHHYCPAPSSTATAPVSPSMQLQPGQPLRGALVLCWEGFWEEGMWQEVLNCRARRQKGTDDTKKAGSRQSPALAAPPLLTSRHSQRPTTPVSTMSPIGQLHTLAWLCPHSLLPGSRLPVGNVAGPGMRGPQRPSPIGSPTSLTGLQRPLQVRTAWKVGGSNKFSRPPDTPLPTLHQPSCLLSEGSIRNKVIGSCKSYKEQSRGM